MRRQRVIKPIEKVIVKPEALESGRFYEFEDGNRKYSAKFKKSEGDRLLFDFNGMTLYIDPNKTTKFEDAYPFIDTADIGRNGGKKTRKHRKTRKTRKHRKY